MAETINFNEWQKLDIRIAKIKSAEDHPQADKLQVMKVDIGGGEEKQLVAGLKGYYSNEDLTGMAVVIVNNLEPATLRGIKSEGMILAAVERDADGKEQKVILLQPEKEVADGTKVE